MKEHPRVMNGGLKTGRKGIEPKIQHWLLCLPLAIWLALGCAEVPYYPEVEPEKPDPPAMISDGKVRCIEAAKGKCSSEGTTPDVDCYSAALVKCENE